jgi:hypothetical protein
LGRSVDKHLPLVLRLGVGNATLNLRFVGQERGGEEKDEEDSEYAEYAHDWLQVVLVYST